MHKTLQALKQTAQITFKQFNLHSQKLVATSFFKNTPDEVNLPKMEKIQYPTKEQLFPEGLHERQYKIPEPDANDMRKLFDPKSIKPVDQRAAYFKINKGKQTYHVFDASKMPLGIMCQQISIFIRGKHKPTYKANRGDCGDKCIVVNAGDLLMTGKKALKKKIFYHTGYVGHLKTIQYKDIIINKPEQLIVWVVSKQLPKNLLRRDLLNKIEIFRGAEHKFSNIAPNFRPAPPEFEFYQKYSPANQALNGDLKITYSSSEEIPKEFAHLPVEIDEEILIPFEDRSKVFKMTPHNEQQMKIWKQYQKKAKRYRVYKPKPPKTNKLDLENDDLFVTSEKQVRRWQIEDKMPQPNDRDIDDESFKGKL